MNRLFLFRLIGIAFLIPSLLAIGCGSPQESRNSAHENVWEEPDVVLPVERLTDLPMSVTNNAVTAVPSPNGAVLFSLMGLKSDSIPDSPITGSEPVLNLFRGTPLDG